MKLSDEELKTLLYDSSRQMVDDVSEKFGNNAEEFACLLEFSLKDIKQFSARAARILCVCAEKNPKLLQPYLNDICDKVFKLKHRGNKHSLLNALLKYKNLKKVENLGKLVDYCYACLESANTESDSLAMKVYSMELLYRVSEIYPEMKNELYLVLKHKTQLDQPALISRGSKVISRLEKDFKKN